MSKKLKNSKKPIANQKKDIDIVTLANLVIEELENENFDLKILQKMQQAFSTASKQKQREAFITIIDKNLKNKQLHKLNRAVMENANELMPDNDTSFVCRTTDNKIFQELLLLEAKRYGIKAKFSSKLELQPLSIGDIPQEILNHYSILKQKFYPQKESKDSVDSRIAQSINFLLYAPLFRESELYTQIGQEKVAAIEVELQKPNGKYVQNLAEGKITEHTEKHINIQEEFENEKKEAAISSIIEESIVKLEKSKKVTVETPQREKIKRHISRFLKEFSTETLTFNKNELIDVIHQELHKKQSRWSKLANYLGISKFYKISGENLKKIGKIINNANFHSSIKPEIQKKLQQLSKNLHKSGTIIPSVDKDKQKSLEQLKESFEELKKLNNPKLPSKVKKEITKSKLNKKPSIKK